MILTTSIKQAVKILSLIFYSLVLTLSYANAITPSKQSSSNKERLAHEKSSHYSLKNALHSFLPRERIEVHTVKNTVILSGNISSVEAASKAEKIVREFHGEGTRILNFMHIKGGQQVMLRVRVGEVKRQNFKEVQATDNSNLNYDYMVQQGLVKTLAEPNLVAMSGERAEFLAGGEFPVPVAQKEGNISVDYKPYGVKVAFTPLVLSHNRIRLSIEPEVSELSKEGSISIRGFNIPSLASRRAKTTIELAPGETFMIAGLIKDEFKNNRRDGTELVISVAPYLVDPVHNKDIRLPTDTKYSPNPLEVKFIDKLGEDLSHQAGKDSSKDITVPLEGPVGFIAE